MQKIETSDILRAKETLLARRRLLATLQEEEEAQPEPSASDAGVEFMTRAVGYQLSPDEREEIVEIDRALDRIDYGRWGVCELCGATIDPDRLAQCPEARECHRCAPRRRERLV